MADKRGIEKGYGIPAQTPEDLFGIAKAYELSRAFHLANNIDVFTQLAEGPLTVAQLSERTGVSPSSLEKLLITAAAAGLLITDGETFTNGLLSDRYLVRGRPDYIGDAVWLTSSWWQRFHDLGTEIMVEHEARHPGGQGVRHERFIEAMNDFAANGEADRLCDALDLVGRTRLLDVGGGPGTFSVYLCLRNPGLVATVLDLPETEPIFRRVVASHGMSDRVSFESGDIEKVSFGECYDVVLVSSIMHGERGDLIPSKAFEALVPGGCIVVRDFVLYPEKNGPLAAALFNTRMGAYTEDQMIDFLRAAGFHEIGSKPLGDFTLITGKKPTESM